MRLIRFAGRLLLSLGIDPRKVLAALRNYPAFGRDLGKYIWLRARSQRREFPFTLLDMHPCVLDRGSVAGSLGHYFHQDLFVARRIRSRAPPHHFDIGSRIDGFVAHLLVFMDVTVVDVRPLASVDGLTYVTADARALDDIPDDSVESLSSLHALEHFGLGRYGDVVDPLGWKTALQEMERILAPGGYFYLSVPAGRERLEFNSQRVFSPATILDACSTLLLVGATLMGYDGTREAFKFAEQVRGLEPERCEKRVLICEFRKSAHAAQLVSNGV